MNADAQMPHEQDGHPLQRRERLRARATRITFAALTIGIVLVALLMQGNPAQSTVLLSVWLISMVSLYLIEVWARKGRIP